MNSSIARRDAMQVLSMGAMGNPTTIVTENIISALEGGESTVLMSPGLCASMVMMFALVKKVGAVGHIITTTDCYRKTRIFIDDFLVPNIKITVHVIDPAGLDGLKSALDKNNVTLLFTESPTKHIALGAGLVLHLATKFIGGPNDVLTGCISGSEEVTAKIHKLHHVLGGTLNPSAVFLVIRGMKTLHLRAQQQNITGLRIAEISEAHPSVIKFESQ
ncbi:hypothetical protein MKX03_019884 [Papaver bracteatum]|nr:hypothetical protein MKX03_019884 [Papaver bracteatum]